MAQTDPDFKLNYVVLMSAEYPHHLTFTRLIKLVLGVVPIPYRVSLKPFVPGKDTRLLFSHSPFTIDNPYNQRGPVFIHKKEVEAYKDI